MSGFLDRVAARALGIASVAHRRSEPLLFGPRRECETQRGDGAAVEFDPPRETERAGGRGGVSAPAPAVTLDIAASVATGERRPAVRGRPTAVAAAPQTVSESPSTAEDVAVVPQTPARGALAPVPLAPPPVLVALVRAELPPTRSEREPEPRAAARATGAEPALEPVAADAPRPARVPSRAVARRDEEPRATASTSPLAPRAAPVADDEVTVEVTIGRIELARPAPAAPLPRVRPAVPRTSLADYLRLRASVRGW